MSNDKKITKSEPIKDLEVLSDDDLENVVGGEDIPTGLPSCCKTGGGGGCCGLGTGTENLPISKGAPGKVELNPLKKPSLTKR